MSSEKVFQAWCPEHGLWSQWTKPVLYAYSHAATGPAHAEPDRSLLSWLPSADRSTALVLDLPGALGAALGPSLALKGFRPVPLYNAMPAPDELQEVVPVRRIAATLVKLAPAMATITLPDHAPPAFLLDSERRLCHSDPIPGSYDNRSICFPTDFPSAGFLQDQGILRVIVIQMDSLEPEPDLARTLIAWQRSGVRIWSKALRSSTPLTLTMIHEPSFWQTAWQWLSAKVLLRRHPLGGFGGILPAPSQG